MRKPAKAASTFNPCPGHDIAHFLAVLVLLVNTVLIDMFRELQPLRAARWMYRKMQADRKEAQNSELWGYGYENVAMAMYSGAEECAFLSDPLHMSLLFVSASRRPQTPPRAVAISSCRACRWRDGCANFVPNFIPHHRPLPIFALIYRVSSLSR